MGNKQTNERHSCAGRVWDRWTHYGCAKPATHFEDEKWWCHVHAPSKIAARKSKKNAEWNAKLDAQRASEVLWNARADALAAKTDIHRDHIAVQMSRFEPGKIVGLVLGGAALQDLGIFDQDLSL